MLYTEKHWKCVYLAMRPHTNARYARWPTHYWYWRVSLPRYEHVTGMRVQQHVGYMNNWSTGPNSVYVFMNIILNIISENNKFSWIHYNGAPWQIAGLWAHCRLPEPGSTPVIFIKNVFKQILFQINFMIYYRVPCSGPSLKTMGKCGEKLHLARTLVIGPLSKFTPDNWSVVSVAAETL